jgi:hypothetical protein
MPQEFIFAQQPRHTLVVRIVRAAFSLLFWTLLIGGGLMASALLIHH